MEEQDDDGEQAAYTSLLAAGLATRLDQGSAHRHRTIPARREGSWAGGGSRGADGRRVETGLTVAA